MLYCKSCRVWVAGTHQRCPLCGGNLSGKREEAPSYPELPENRSFTKRLIQIISGAALTAAIICVAVNLLVPTGIWWSLFAVLGLGCGWLWAVVGIVKKAKLLNNIVWQLVLISGVAFLWDWLTGWRGWSVDYVFPSVCIGAMLAVIILSRVLRMPDRDYMIHLILCAVLGVVLLNVQNKYNFLESVVYGITGGLGFLLAIVLFASVRERVEFAEYPECFE